MNLTPSPCRLCEVRVQVLNCISKAEEGVGESSQEQQQQKHTEAENDKRALMYDAKVGVRLWLKCIVQL